MTVLYSDKMMYSYKCQRGANSSQTIIRYASGLSRFHRRSAAGLAMSILAFILRHSKSSKLRISKKRHAWDCQKDMKNRGSFYSYSGAENNMARGMFSFQAGLRNSVESFHIKSTLQSLDA